MMLLLIHASCVADVVVVNVVDVDVDVVVVVVVGHHVVVARGVATCYGYVPIPYVPNTVHYTVQLMYGQPLLQH